MEVRVCEICGTLNEVHLSECKNCSEDLAYTPISEIEENINSNIEEQRTNNSTEEKSVVKDTANKGNNSKSSNIKKTMVLNNKKMVNRNDGKEIEIPFIGALIGRDGNVEVEYFESFPYISNSHIIAEYISDDLFITDVGSTNGTKVNGKRIEKGQKTKVNNGDIIQLANVEFIIS